MNATSSRPAYAAAHYRFDYNKVLAWASEFVENIDHAHCMDDFHHREIAQKTAIKVWRHENDFSKYKCTPRGYVAMVTLNEARTEYRKVMSEKGRLVSYDSVDFSALDWARGSERPADWLLLSNEAEGIWEQSQGELSDRSRRVIGMIDDEYTNEQIAAAEGISKNAAAKLRFDSKNRFESRLRANGYYGYLPEGGVDARANRVSNDD